MKIDAALDATSPTKHNVSEERKPLFQCHYDIISLLGAPNP